MNRNGSKWNQWLLWLGLAAAVVWLVVNHGAHLWELAPFLIILACPLMHLFGHGGHAGHGQLSFARPRSRRDWHSFGAFSSFLVALFAEMPGFPRPIYLLSGGSMLYAGQRAGMSASADRHGDSRSPPRGLTWVRHPGPAFNSNAASALPAVAVFRASNRSSTCV